MGGLSYQANMISPMPRGMSLLRMTGAIAQYEGNAGERPYGRPSPYLVPPGDCSCGVL
jgi:hypothetical protein